MSIQTTILNAFLERYIYVIQGDLVCDTQVTNHLSFFRYHEFQHATANETYKKTTTSGLKKKMPYSALWLEHPDRKTAVQKMYYPNQPRWFSYDEVMNVNTYSAPEFRVTSNTDNLAVFYDHISYLFEHEEDAIWFFQWMAFCVQRPELRSKVTPLHIAAYHGTGRGWLVELLEILLGVSNCTRTKMKQLCADRGFHDYLANSTLCIIDEVRDSEKKYEVDDTIRDILTENRLEINQKYGQKKTQRVFTNLLFFSNHIDAMVIKKEDRRINVFLSSRRPRESSYYDRLYGWLDTDGPEQLYNVLLNLNLENFNWTRSVASTAREMLIGSNRNTTEEMFFSLLDALPAKVLTFQQVKYEVLKLTKEAGYNTDDIDERQLIKLLQQHALRSKAIKLEGVAIKPWIFETTKNWTPVKLRREVSQPHLSSPTHQW